MFWDELLLHFTFAAFALAQLLKLTDFILSKDQQKWIQDQFELLALRVDAIRPLNLYRTLISKNIIRFAAIACMVSVPLLLMSGIVFDPSIESPKKEAVPFFLAWLSCAFFLGYVVHWALQKQGQEVLEYFYAEGKFRTFFIRYLKSMMYGAGLGFAIVLWYSLASRVSEVWQPLMGMAPMVALAILVCVRFRIVLLWYIFQFLGLFICATWLVLLVFSSLASLLRAIVWRVATYNKGATAALTLLITLILGIVEFYLKQMG